MSREVRSEISSSSHREARHENQSQAKTHYHSWPANPQPRKEGKEHLWFWRDRSQEGAEIKCGTVCMPPEGCWEGERALSSPWLHTVPARMLSWRWAVTFYTLLSSAGQQPGQAKYPLQATDNLQSALPSDAGPNHASITPCSPAAVSVGHTVPIICGVNEEVVPVFMLFSAPNATWWPMLTRHKELQLQRKFLL